MCCAPWPDRWHRQQRIIARAKDNYHPPPQPPWKEKLHLSHRRIPKMPHALHRCSSLQEARLSSCYPFSHGFCLKKKKCRVRAGDREISKWRNLIIKGSFGDDDMPCQCLCLGCEEAIRLLGFPLYPEPQSNHKQNTRSIQVEKYFTRHTARIFKTIKVLVSKGTLRNRH